MTKQFMVGAIPLRLPDGQHEIAFQLNDPGKVLTVAWCLEKKLVMTRGDASFDEVLTMFVEVSPNGPKRNRRFVVLPTEQELSVKDGNALTFVGSAVSTNTGAIAHVFEVKAVS